MDICEIHKKFSEGISHNKREYMCNLSALGKPQLSTNPLGKIPMTDLSPFSNICMLVYQVGHTIDRRISTQRVWHGTCSTEIKTESKAQGGPALSK